MTETLETLKNTVKKHTVVPFTAQDITCDSKQLIINDRFVASKPKKVLETLGIRDNLIAEIFDKPEVNWSAIRGALNTINPNKSYGGIVDSNNNLLTLTKAPKEASQLNFDKRLDELFNAIDSSQNHDLQSATWNPLDCNVSVNCTNRGIELECGHNDNWKFGTTSIIGDTMQTFANYFLRLVCTNGMTTRDNLAYRTVTATTNIAKQFLKFASKDLVSSSVVNRVQRLRNNRASLYELMSVASNLKKEERDEFMPEYGYTVERFANAGHPVDSFSAARSKFVFTNENLYDVFNLATNLATHQRERIGDGAAQQLNKVAGEMFSKGPNLDFQILDIWKN